MTLWEDLEYRGLVKDVSSPDLKRILNEEKITFYWGTDPSADSLHLGHYSSLVTAKRLMMYGHKPILLIGGSTGLIGDPRPTAEREIISKEVVENNIKGIKKQVDHLFSSKAKIVNNYDWTKDVSFLSFLRDIGKYINVNYMLDKDIIRRRLDTGITYAEFSYTLLQGYDFLHLFMNENCILQAEGSDQWGNITTGIELIKKKLGKEAYGFTMPLILDANGKKFGKSEGNALWLDKSKTSVYDLYQYLINTDDKKVIEYLKVFTFLTKEEIEEIEEKQNKEPEKRYAHEQLARQIITDIHGEDDYFHARDISKALFTGDVANLTDKDILDVFKDMPFFKYHQDEVFIDILVNNKIASSKREAREFLNNKAISENGVLVSDENYKLDEKRQYQIIRRGKKRYYILERS